MTKNIIINGQVVFDPEANCLFPVAQPEACITIPKPASRCLLILISHHGNVVTMAQFHEQAWSCNNVVVSDQSIYQNISLLRKALTEVGVSKNIVETRTRRGWIISEDILIAEGECKSNSESSKNESCEVADDEVFVDLLNDSGLVQRYIPFFHKKNFVMHMFTLVFSTSVVFLSYALWTSYHAVHTWPLYKYHKLTDISGCHIFRNPSNTEDNTYIEFIQRNNIKCDNRPWWYITNYIPSGYFSLIACKEPLLQKSSKSPDCISYSFLGLKDDNTKN